MCRLWCFLKSQPRVKTAREVHPGYAQLHVPFLLGIPYARRSGDEGESDRDSEGGDLSAVMLDMMPSPADDEAECDLDGRVAPKGCESRSVSCASVGGDAIPLKPEYEYEDT